MCVFSIKAVFKPALAKATDRGVPACPEPMIRASYFVGLDIFGFCLMRFKRVMFVFTADAQKVKRCLFLVSMYCNILKFDCLSMSNDLWTMKNQEWNYSSMKSFLCLS